MTGGNTIVVFTSDHGEMLGDHYMWRKSRAFESCARVPFLVRAPQHFELRQGAVVDQPAGHEDLMPTLLDMAEIDIPETVEGQSLLPLMRGEDVAWRDYLPIEHSPYHQALTDGREKFIWSPGDGRELFFDLTVDPHELHDLSRDPDAAERVTLWRDRLIQELTGRPEGFTDGERLIPGRPYGVTLPGA